MQLVLIGRSPAYMADMMTATADLPGRERLPKKRKLEFGERGFSYAGPKAWNSLPSKLTNTDTFKKQLKTHLSLLSSIFSAIRRAGLQHRGGMNQARAKCFEFARHQMVQWCAVGMHRAVADPRDHTPND